MSKRTELTGRSAVTAANIERAKNLVIKGGMSEARLQGVVAFLDKAMAAIRTKGPSSSLWKEFPTVMNFHNAAASTLEAMQALEEGTRPSKKGPRFVGLKAPTSIAEGTFPYTSHRTQFDLRRRDGHTFLWTAPAPMPMRAMMKRAAKSVEVHKNRAGGYNVHFPNKQSIVGAEWKTATLRELIKKGDARLEKLERGAIDLDEQREILVLKSAGDKEPTLVIGGAGMRTDGTPFGGPGRMRLNTDRNGVTVICTDVQFVPFSSSGGGGGGMITIKKPVVYLYPQKVQDVTVKVDVDGEFIALYPKQNPKMPGTWSVKAGPTGEIFDPMTERRYPYLFWEATRGRPIEIDAAKAASIPGADAEMFLEDVANKYALNDRERTDFVSYWLPALAQNPYSLVQVLSDDEYDRYASMTITPAPDTVNRLFMVFRREETPSTPNRTLALSQRTRSGFTVVEWGGTNLDERKA